MQIDGGAMLQRHGVASLQWAQTNADVVGARRQTDVDRRPDIVRCEKRPTFQIVDTHAGWLPMIRTQPAPEQRAQPWTRASKDSAPRAVVFASADQQARRRERRRVRLRRRGCARLALAHPGGLRVGRHPRCAGRCCTQGTDPGHLLARAESRPSRLSSNAALRRRSAGHRDDAIARAAPAPSAAWPRLPKPTGQATPSAPGPGHRPSRR